MRLLFALAALLIATPAISAPAKHWWESGPPLPEMTGRVVDGARLLGVKEREVLIERLAQLQAMTHHQFVIVTVASLDGQKIEDYGIRLGRTWAVGRKGHDDGVILIVAPNERKVRIEVGRGLEKALTDPVCMRIIRDAILPRFQSGDMAGGIEAGAVAIIAQIGGQRS